MKFDEVISQIKSDAIKAADSHKVDFASVDYKVGYVRGVRMMSMLVELSHLVALRMAIENEDNETICKMLTGYANGLKKIVDMADDIIPPEYETGAA